MEFQLGVPRLLAISIQFNRSLDALAVMRRRLEESVLEDSTKETKGSEEEGEGEREGKEEGEGKEGEGDDTDMAINVLPPTPTVVSRDMLGTMEGVAGGMEGVAGDREGVAGGGETDSLTVGRSVARGGATPTVPVTAGGREKGEEGKGSKFGSGEEEGTDQGGPFYSPASSRSSPDLKKVSCLCVHAT